MTTLSPKSLYISPSIFKNIFSDEIIKEIENKNTENMYAEYKSFESNTVSSLFKKVRYIPLSSGDLLDYESEKWSFEKYIFNTESHNCINFNDVPECFLDIEKDFLLFLILNGNVKFSTIYKRHSSLRVFLKSLINQGVYDVNLITIKEISYFIRSLNDKTTRTIIDYKTVIKSFLNYYDCEYNTKILTPDIIEECKRTEFRKLKVEINNNRRKPIPAKYFDNLLSILIQKMDDENETLDDRAIAGMLIICSQTGVRVSELTLLESNCIEEEIINNKKYYVMNFKIIKTATTNNGYIKNKTYVNDLCYRAFNVVKKIMEENRKKLNTNLLYCPIRGKLPVTGNKYIEYLKRFCIENYDVLDITNECYKDILTPTTINNVLSHRYSKHLRDTLKEKGIPNEKLTYDTPIYIPLVHQFRNTFVDRLLREGTPIDYIRMYLGHISDEMTSSYAGYNDNDIQENLAFSKDVLETYLKGEAKILGPSGNKIMDGINNFIEENNFNVNDNFDLVIESLLKKIPIRAKHGGMCIKGAKLTNACSVDARTDEFYCACGVCPNICHYFFTANVSYNDFVATKEIYYYNKENGFTKQSEKEKDKVNFILANRLIPELNELDKEIKLQGKEKIIEKYKALKSVVDNYDCILKEIEKWQMENH